MPKFITIILTALNIGTVCWLGLRQSAPASAAAETYVAPPRFDSSAPAPPAPAIAPSATAFSPSKFHWSQIESADYRTYVRNLRRVGCPEATVRDILTADLHALYEGRRNHLRSATNSSAILASEIARLNTEETQLLSNLLGDHADSPPTVAPVSTSYPETLVRTPELVAGFEVKRARLEQWQQQHESEKAALFARTGGNIETETDAAQLQALERARDQALNMLLTPEEREEFDLSHSMSSRFLQNAILGFEVTESEFRALFKARQQYDRDMDALDRPDETDAARRNFYQRAEQALGPERFSYFKLAQDPEYQAFYADAAAQGKDPASTASLWEQYQDVTSTQTVSQMSDR